MPLCSFRQTKYFFAPLHLSSLRRAHMKLKKFVGSVRWWSQYFRWECISADIRFFLYSMDHYRHLHLIVTCASAERWGKKYLNSISWLFPFKKVVTTWLMIYRVKTQVDSPAYISDYYVISLGSSSFWV